MKTKRVPLTAEQPKEESGENPVAMYKVKFLQVL